MKIIHTSDWHLGKMLYGRRCHAEFKAFLHWLTREVERQQADYLLVSGDIFDTTTPANSIQSLYYSFLHNISSTSCRHVIITGGNHDSPSLLHAPRKLLEQLNVTVVGSAPSNIANEVIPLRDSKGDLKLIVCAVPYLRDRDVRKSEAGETIDTKARKLIQGIAEHYTEVAGIAKSLQNNSSRDVPIIGMGHLFTAGGQIEDNNEIRDLYVGSLSHVHSSIFPKSMDYIALGHLHSAQTVNELENIRYSGSPLQLSFNKQRKVKSITALTFSDELTIEQIEVPPFLNLRSIQGNYDDLVIQIDKLISENVEILLEIIITDEIASSSHEDFLELVAGSKVEILRVINQNLMSQMDASDFTHNTLDRLSELEVFRKCLDTHAITDSDRMELEQSFQEILTVLHEEDEE